MQLHIVKYSGAFGYIKPWTAVRDSETFSQQFLTPSIVEGIEKKLFPELLAESGIHKILRHRLSYAGLSKQQEQTQPRGIDIKNKKGVVTVQRPRSILLRGVMLEPLLLLAFKAREDAERAIRQHLCLCRNEDVILPTSEIISVAEEEFDAPEGGFNGFELRFGETPESFIVGYNRFDSAKPMYGYLHIVGDPIRSSEAAYHL
ncbi:MAG: hypothetical protein H9535_12770 [Ignavibacteria bacterium]|nr:hypothetical protein [Ignavibacteria bacterium]